MTQPPSITPEDRYAALVAALRNQPGVTYLSDGPPSNKFGSNALKVNRKIFAMLVRGYLVVKLPRTRVDALVAAGGGERFDPSHGQGRIMREWLVVASASADDWLALAHEALAFVGGQK
ncbi:MAG TPA: hypothetical protein VMV29_23930 [Ktedonobacterales bacterium]|nr:hypothetical protein [Ktedonobacterales bacterium]